MKSCSPRVPVQVLNGGRQEVGVDVVEHFNELVNAQVLECQSDGARRRRWRRSVDLFDSPDVVVEVRNLGSSAGWSSTEQRCAGWSSAHTIQDEPLGGRLGVVFKEDGRLPWAFLLGGEASSCTVLISDPAGR